MDKEKKPLISILVPIYNVEKYIGRCLDSLFEQTYDKVEYIFVDDCTPDNSISILNERIQKYSHLNIFVIHHEVNRGLAASRLTALKAATGTYIWNVDSDDYIKKNAVEIFVNEINNCNNNVDIFVFNYIIENSKSKIPFKRFNNSNAEIFKKKLLTYRTSPCIWGQIMKKSLFFDNNIFPIEGIDFAEDISVSIRLFFSAKTISFIDEYLYVYNQVNINSYVNNVSSKSYESLIKANEINIQFLKKKEFKIYNDYVAILVFNIINRVERRVDKNKYIQLYEEVLPFVTLKTYPLFIFKKLRLKFLSRIYLKCLVLFLKIN